MSFMSLARPRWADMLHDSESDDCSNGDVEGSSQTRIPSTFAVQRDIVGYVNLRDANTVLHSESESGSIGNDNNEVNNAVRSLEMRGSEGPHCASSTKFELRENTLVLDPAACELFSKSTSVYSTVVPPGQVLACTAHGCLLGLHFLRSRSKRMWTGLLALTFGLHNPPACQYLQSVSTLASDAISGSTLCAALGRAALISQYCSAICPKGFVVYCPLSCTLNHVRGKRPPTTMTLSSLLTYFEADGENLIIQRAEPEEIGSQFYCEMDGGQLVLRRRDGPVKMGEYFYVMQYMPLIQRLQRMDKKMTMLIPCSVENCDN